MQIILHLATMFRIICDNSQKKRVYIFQKDAVNGEYWDCLRLKDLKKYIDGILTYSATNEGDTNWMLDAELVRTWVLFLHWSQFSNLPDKLENLVLNVNYNITKDSSLM